ncbi:type VI secretion system membrane subunit TssM [Thalassomonas actiniarum]|uniref:Type VI secretion system membrane subunit TssM n=1 Tax=Thalassomonas actiniarum TaxID=485447 RepID=A0AAE9YX89_9GAMM|nr:type VI secretion system membrane subunit TssM [Thalassomonas actiniarum]WDE01178.1 type VI secretion system membrane subunit TssM [Thalassomonas actiniarum]
MSFKETSKKYLSKLKPKVLITALGLICLALLIWFGGPLIAIAGYEPLLSPSARIIVLLLIVITWGLFNLSFKAKDKKNNEQVVNNLINGEEADAGSAEDRAKTEIALLHKKMAQAIEILKNTKFEKNKGIYELPWYIMVGPPGSGKTTAIQNSGLEYPLKEKMGIDMIQGVGGTRHCDWWFTNKAVLIDTAGRYTTQDSHAKQDARAWQGFLGLLKKFRPLRPINGVIISMGMAELLNQTKTERNLHARAIKQRLQELQNQLGMTFPVYVLLSKSDLVAGFNEFFDDFAKEDCEQIWGVTFDLKAQDEQGSTVSGFNKEFHGLLKNLNARINTRLKVERDLDRRAIIYEFPKQLRLLQSAADDFLKEIFSPNAYEEVPMLRGVYLTSATQEGTPIDHLSAHLSTGVRNQVKSQPAKHVRGYFIKGLLEEVIFPEKNLASTNRQHDKQNNLLRRGVIAAASVLTLGLSFAWWSSYDWNSGLVDQTQEALTYYQQVSDGGLNKDTEIITLTKGLTSLRALPVGYDGEPLVDARTMGLYQGDKLKQPAIAAYERALQGYLLPYLMKVLSQEMANNALHLNYLYETLKIYLMLYDAGHYLEEDVKIWFSAYFDRNIPGEINAGIRSELNQHLATALELGMRGEDYAENVVAHAREALTMLPLVERAYQRLKSDFMQSSIPDFKLVDILSPDSLEGFTFQSGRNFNQGIPGLFTYSGFHGIFSIEKKRVIKRLIEDSWVYGDDLNTLDEDTKIDIAEQLEQKYIRDYIFYWEDFLSDLTLKSYANSRDGAKITHALSSPDAPVKSIIAAVKKNVQLTKIPLSNNEKAAAGVVKNATDLAFQSKKSRLSRLLPDKGVKLDLELPGKEVEQAFSDLLAIDLQQLDKVQGILRSINRNLDKVSLTNSQASSYMNQRLESNFEQLGNELSEQIVDMPYPLANWLDTIATQTKGLARANQNERLNGIWKSQVLSEFRRGISGRYPFNRKSSKDVRLKDFSRFFGYQGTLDKFWHKYLKDYVDTSQVPWHFTKDIGISPDILTMYQNTEKIREAFFETGMKSPRINFSLQPQSLDRNVSLFMLEIDGQQLNYRHGPPRKEQFIWPGPSANSETRIAFTPPNGGRSINAKYAGEWSLFRFLDKLKRERPKTKSDGLLEITLSGYNAKLKFMPNSVNNPFWMLNLEGFSCPTTL